MDNFYGHKSYENLKAEFDEILNTKKYIAQLSLDDIKKLLAE